MPARLGRAEGQGAGPGSGSVEVRMMPLETARMIAGIALVAVCVFSAVTTSIAALGAHARGSAAAEVIVV
jgi:hypothetical protein